MKLNVVIKTRRQALGMTQEQVGSYLGVSTPAVSKWETAASYPDITLLPPLARLLQVDLNTLLSFQDSLTDQEIGHFLNALTERMESQGFAAGFAFAQEKLREFPNCHRLLCFTAIQLQGGLHLFGGDLPDKTPYAQEIHALLKRAATGDDSQAREQALYFLILNALGRNDTACAEELLSSLPPRPGLDRRTLEAKLRLAQGRREEGCRILEEQLLTAANTALGTLLQLQDIAQTDGRKEDVHYLTKTAEDLVTLLHLWPLTSFLVRFQLSRDEGDKAEMTTHFCAMLDKLSEPWDMQSSPLYCHVPSKPEAFPVQKVLAMLLRDLDEDEELAFLREHPAYDKSRFVLGVE